MTEIMKRKKGQILNNNERQLILNLMNYLKEKNSGKSISEVIREISKATGCSERTIYKIRKEASKGILVTASKTRQRKRENKNSRNVKYDSFVKSSIRKKVHNYFLQNVPPTLNAILHLVNNDPDLPNFKRSTLHTLLKEIGFVYKQIGKKSVLSERNDSITLRQQYLKAIRKFRSENRWIVYTGETLISVMKNEVISNCEQKKMEIIHEQHVGSVPLGNGGALNNISADPTPELLNGTLVYAIDTTSLTNVCYENTELNRNVTKIHQIPSGIPDNIPLNAILSDEPTSMRESGIITNKKDTKPGEINGARLLDYSFRKHNFSELRLTIMHAGSESGFIQGVEHVTLSKKKNEEIENYEHWFLEKLLPKIPPNSVIVTDNNAHYHQKKEENIPDSSWKKNQIRNWLLSKNINLDEVKQKKELLDLVNNVRPLYSTKRKIDEVAKQRGIIIVNLPPFHYELNPLNLVLAKIKFYVRSNMKSFKIKRIKRLIREGCYAITQINWMNYAHLIRQTEELLWAIDEMQDNHQNLNSYTAERDSNKESNVYM